VGVAVLCWLDASNLDPSFAFSTDKILNGYLGAEPLRGSRSGRVRVRVRVSRLGLAA
jgi:hypothetical protein